jgi:hypothetical protein
VAQDSAILEPAQYDDGLSITAARNAAAAALTTWQGQSTLTFPREDSGAADIKIEWVNDDQMDNPGKPAEAGRPPFGDIKLNRDYRWVISTNPSGNDMDLESTVLHEAGHAIGLSHSTASRATMIALVNNVDRTLDLDDQVGIGLLYNAWDLLDGQATAIDIGGTSASPSVWILGRSPFGNGFKIYQRIGSVWQVTNNNSGVPDDFSGYRLTVDGAGVPYVVQTNGGSIWKRTTATANSGAWVAVAAGTCASDIDAGSDGSV